MRRAASKGRMCRSRRSARISSISTWSPNGSSTYRSGCVRRSARGRSPSNSPAKANAKRRLPTPGGPWKRYACAGPSVSAASSRRFASSCSGKRSKLIPHLLRQLRRRLRAVQRRDPVREQPGELAVGLVDFLLEREPFLLDAIRLCGTLDRLRGIEQDEERPVREQTARRMQVQLEHPVDAEPTRKALVGERRVDVAVADDVRPVQESRVDDLLDELCARRREQRRLAPGRDVDSAQEELTDPFTEFGAARLARRDHAAPIAAKSLGEELGLRRLAGAVDSLEGNEHGPEDKARRRRTNCDLWSTRMPSPTRAGGPRPSSLRRSRPSSSRC